MSLITLAITAASFVPSPCGFEGVAAGFEKQNGIECGWVSVPRDDHSRKTIRLWTARVRASGPAKQTDPILYINGGPGIATVDVVVPGIPNSQTMTALRRDRDIIVFDQRGSGRSEEAMCPALGKTFDVISALGLSPADEEERNQNKKNKTKIRSVIKRQKNHQTEQMVFYCAALKLREPGRLPPPRLRNAAPSSGRRGAKSRVLTGPV